MAAQIARIEYSQLKARQEENYNFLKVSAVLADYGYMTMRLSADWEGADFIAQHVKGAFLKVQLKSRPAFRKKYLKKDLYVAFPHRGDWYLYPHDEVLRRVLEKTTVATTASWLKRGGYSFPGLTQQLQAILAPYKISGDTSGIEV